MQNSNKRHEVLNDGLRAATLCALSILLCGLSLCACSKEEAKTTAPAPMEISVASAVKRDVPVNLEFVGQTKGAIDAEVAGGKTESRAHSCIL